VNATKFICYVTLQSFEFPVLEFQSLTTSGANIAVV